jgi:hypothetical protein
MVFSGQSHHLTEHPLRGFCLHYNWELAQQAQETYCICLLQSPAALCHH